MSDYQLGRRVETPGDHYALLRYVVGLDLSGMALEFGVGKGESTGVISERMPVYGFDCFEGLPEDWREGFPAGSFKFDPPNVPGAALVIGLFEDTLPWWAEAVGPVGLVHIDCDLYSSTKTVLDNIGHLLQPGTCIVFDEWYGYDGCEQHEQKAWREFAERTGIGWTVIGHGFEQWAIQITDTGESNV